MVNMKKIVMDSFKQLVTNSENSKSDDSVSALRKIHAFFKTNTCKFFVMYLKKQRAISDVILPRKAEKHLLALANMQNSVSRTGSKWKGLT